MSKTTTNERNGNGRGVDVATNSADRISSANCLGNADCMSNAPVLIYTAQPHERLSLLLPALSRFPKLDLKTMHYHAQQSDATADDGYWHAAINEARSFMEALVISIALRDSRETLDEFRKGKETHGGIRLYRRYLYNVGFLDMDEDILITSVYSIASAKGGHFGVSDESWCRVARRMVWTTSDYLIQRYERWNAGDRRPKVGTPNPQKPSTTTVWKERLRNLFRR